MCINEKWGFIYESVVHIQYSETAIRIGIKIPFNA